MNIAEIIGHQHLRILALEETLGQRELEISLLKEKVMKLTPAIEVISGVPPLPEVEVPSEARNHSSSKVL